MFDANVIVPYQERAIFIQKQIKICVNAIQKNLEEIANIANKNEKNILKELNAILERKKDCLKKELEYVEQYLHEIENKE